MGKVNQIGKVNQMGKAHSTYLPRKWTLYIHIFRLSKEHFARYGLGYINNILICIVFKVCKFYSENTTNSGIMQYIIPVDRKRFT